MSYLKKLLFTYIILIFLCQLAYSQNKDTPLSFDKSEVSFSKIRNFVFRGDDFFYEKTYNNIKHYTSKFRLAIFLEGSINGREATPFEFKQKEVNLSPTASVASINIMGYFRNYFYQFYANNRIYSYFTYTKDDNEINGNLYSEIGSFAIGKSNKTFTPIICINRLESRHENHEDESLKLPEEYREIYLERYTEVNDRLNQIGFDEKEKYSFSFIGYSKKYGIGTIIAPEYVSLDLNYFYGRNSDNKNMEFSQIGLNTFKLIEKSTDIKFSKNNLNYDYSLEANFSSSLFKNFKNVFSDLIIDWDWRKNYAGLKTKFKFNHSKNLLSFFSISLRYYGFKIGYQYINNKIFMPNIDRIYNNTITFSLGGGFSPKGELIVP